MFFWTIKWLANKVNAAVLLLWVVEQCLIKNCFAAPMEGARVCWSSNKSFWCPMQENISMFIVNLIYKDNSGGKYALLNMQSIGGKIVFCVRYTNVFITCFPPLSCNMTMIGNSCFRNHKHVWNETVHT